MIWIGGLLVILTFYAIFKRYESRLVLFVSGVAMALLAGNPLEAVKAFSGAMVNDSLVPVICTVMGFSFVMKWTKCDTHLVTLLTGTLTKFRLFLIPGAVLITFIVNTALTSAAGCAAAVGAVLIPTLMRAGVHPAIAASAIMAGTWGGSISPGGVHNPFIAKIADLDIMTVVAFHFKIGVISMLIAAISLTVIAYLRKEHTGCGVEDKEAGGNTSYGKVNYLMAFMPLFPLALLVLGSHEVHILPPVSVPQAMLIGVFLALLITRTNVQEVTKQFFNGMGSAYGNIIGIIIAAMVFTKGMEVIGLTGALVDAMKNSEHIARLSATFGPFIMAVLTGSADATIMAFNSTITPHASQFGFGILEMATQAHMAGVYGRAMSPVAGATIVCAQLAGVNPMEVTRRNWPGALLAAVICMFILM